VQQETVSALPKIITTGFKSIQLIYFFTAGEDEVKCWQIRKGTKAPQVTLRPLSCPYFSVAGMKSDSLPVKLHELGLGLWVWEQCCAEPCM
jgi:hypothetical protein